ncbi:metal ABC transporter solute-binding protein, Zn/Mn family [Streptomyces sp. SM12]|uniref:metal ABC transporter solute-binding protein, Zn/Mn family n=1 Tax=Streptomyces sp. SM12 TaxID=1071602 RepID=UPI000CD4FC4A|nr:zinc ABC transporter substrate-binding protein [Streptomyces sp. SM12]
MARTRLPLTSLVALTVALTFTAACGSDTGASAEDGAGSPSAETAEDRDDGDGDQPVIVATTTWQGAFASAAGIDEVTVIVPQSVHHAPDYDPKPSDLAAIAEADFVLYAPFEPYAEQIRDAAGSGAELVEVDLDNDPDVVSAEVARLGALFGTESAAQEWNESFESELGELNSAIEDSWPDGESPRVVTQVYTGWAAKLAGATTVGTYGPEAVTPAQLAELSAEEPDLVLDNAHMSAGEVLPGSGAVQLDVVNYPGDDLDLLTVYRDLAEQLQQALAGS